MEQSTPQYHTLTITGIKEEVDGVKVFTFDGATANNLPYKAGQYLTLVHQHPQGEIRRSYSITSAPALKEPLSIGVKRIENGFYSRQLVDQAKVGDQVLTTGAAGLFTLPDNISAYKQIFLLAAGSGITPIYSLLKEALYTYPELSLVLLYSNNSPARAMFLKPLQELAEAHPGKLHIEFLFSNSPDLNRARLHKDLLKTFLHNLSISPPQQQLFYLCGPENYMRLTSYALRQAGVPANNIRKEIFNIVKVPPKVQPPDTEAHTVILHFKGEKYNIESEYPNTILQSARKAGAILPYSCETGKCGSCLAKILKGKVWMSYNEVLTERDLEKGLILTCVGYPVGGDVELKVL
ncbi:ferredoxin--NADP reductase [uncultured Pontibacter sp.]|uniref:ferredoxin--NADP reductase n=1 Tax=uncultured Pontibacter sp. TaxID=453356 RepID=UPI00261CCE42|nr:ferredoxin--NADP reductase [uncultured Pontibacter sp.]